MKGLISIFLTFILIPLVACNSPSTSETLQGEQPTTKKKISLDDSQSILDLSTILPSNFEELDAASEGLSHEDMGLEPECSEVYVFFSEDQPYQLIYHFLAITESKIEAASFDTGLEDEATIESMLIDAIKSGAAEGGIEIDLPNISITHPIIGDKAVFGHGDIEAYGLVYGMDILWFRSNKVFYFGYSLNFSEDNESLETIAKEIAKRIDGYSQ